MSKNTEITIKEGEKVPFRTFTDNIRDMCNIICKVQNAFYKLQDDPYDLDVALKNIERDIPKRLHPEIYKIVRRGVTRIRMHPTEESIGELDILLDHINRNLKRFELRMEALELMKQQDIYIDIIDGSIKIFLSKDEISIGSDEESLGQLLLDCIVF